MGIKNMVAKDIYELFKDFNPSSFERVDANSANVSWALPSSSAKAMLALSKPILKKLEEDMEDEQRLLEDDEVLIRVSMTTYLG